LPDQHSPRSILVTGAAGFIGANFVRYWSNRYPETRVIALDALTYAGNRVSIADLETRHNFVFVHQDIRDSNTIEQVMREHSVDTLVHFAAESHVDRSIHGPDEFIETNIVGTHSLLKAARAVWLNSDNPVAHRFHHVSTDEVYGSLATDAPGFTEETPYAPNSPYAASKAASDHLVRSYHRTYGLNVVTSNCSNNYGPYQLPEKLIPLVLINILHNRALPIYGDGLNVRDWLYVEDHCRGIDLCIRLGRAGETYNIGGGREHTNIQIVTSLCKRVDELFANNPALAERFPDAPPAKGLSSGSLITHVKDRPGHDRRYAINGAKIQKELGYRPEEDFDTGIAKTIDWYLANQLWWETVLSGEYQKWIDKHYQDDS